MVAAVTIILGTGDFALTFGNFNLGGIGTATFAALFLNWFFSLVDKNNSKTYIFKQPQAAFYIVRIV